eukprot:gene40619-50253_t
MIVGQQIKEIESKKEASPLESSSTAESVTSSLSAVKLSSAPNVPLHRVCKVICKLFADQLVADQKNVETTTPSNACKYVPHYTRHFNKKPASSKRKADGEASESESEGAAAAPMERVARGGRTGGRGGRGGGGGRGRGRGGAVAWSEAVVEPVVVVADGDKKARSVANIANCLMADEICRLACPTEFAARRGKAAFRKLRAGLNRELVKKGHLIEPLMCTKQLDKINFARASEGALSMCTAAIKKGGQSARWTAAMARNSNAVPDIDSLGRAVSEYLAEQQQVAGEDALKMFDLRVSKALKSIQTSRDKLVAKATELQAAKARGEASDETAVEPVTVPVVGVVVDTVMCSDHEARMSLVLAAYLMTKSQGLNHLVVDGVVHSLVTTNVAVEDGAADTTTDVAWHRLVPAQSADATTKPSSRLCGMRR